MILDADHVAVDVPDIEPVRRFYENVLGLTVVREAELAPGLRAQRLVFFRIGGLQLEFLQVPGTPVPCSFHICFRVANLTETMETLKAAGSEQIQPVHDHTRPEGTRLKWTMFRGPAGETLEFQEVQ